MQLKQKHDEDSKKIIGFLVENGHDNEAKDYIKLSEHLFEKNATACLNVHHMNLNFFIKKIQSLQCDISKLNDSLEEIKEFSKMASNKELSQARRIELLEQELNKHVVINQELNASLHSYEKRYNSITMDLTENYNNKLEALKQFHSYLDSTKLSDHSLPVK
jgi:hypothetical protein